MWKLSDCSTFDNKNIHSGGGLIQVLRQHYL